MVVKHCFAPVAVLIAVAVLFTAGPALAGPCCAGHDKAGVVKCDSKESCKAQCKAADSECKKMCDSMTKAECEVKCTSMSKADCKTECKDACGRQCRKGQAQATEVPVAMVAARQSAQPPAAGATQTKAVAKDKAKSAQGPF